MLAYGNFWNRYRANPAARVETQLVWCMIMSSVASDRSPYFTSRVMGSSSTVDIVWSAAASLSSLSHSIAIIPSRMRVSVFANCRQPVAHSNTLVTAWYSSHGRIDRTMMLQRVGIEGIVVS